MKRFKKDKYSHQCFQTNVIVISILHDIVEDTLCTVEEIKEAFNSIVAYGVEKLTRVKADRKISAQDVMKELYNKKERDLLIVKLFDRLHNLETISSKTPEKQRNIKLETKATFVPIAKLIGEFSIAQKLSELTVENNHC